MAFNPLLFYEYGKGRGSKTFISRWNTANTSTGSSAATQVKLPLETTGTYNFIVDWGDGSALENITSGATQPVHDYGAAGTYTISITGIIIGFKFVLNASDNLKILSISKWGPLRLGNNGGYFAYCANITLNTITDILNLTGTSTLASMFFECRLITTVGRMNEWNLSNVTNLSSMFGQSVASGTVGAGLFNQDIGAWNVSNVISFNSMFRFTALFNNGGSDSIKNWNVSSATDMGAMFSRANSFNQPIANWERSTVGNTSTLANVINMNDTFSSGNTANSFNQPIGNWNVSNVTGMSNLFYRSRFNQDISGWNISKVASWGSFGIAGSFTPFSPTNLDLIYNGWSTRTVVPNCSITFSSKYTTSGSAGKAILQASPYFWTITDGGL